MNFHKYGQIYSKFHQCSLLGIQNDIIIFDLVYSDYETFMLSRLYPSNSIRIDSKKPLLSALKAYFKFDEVASVVSNHPHYNWTVCIGNRLMIYPVAGSVEYKNKFQFYATPYFVNRPEIIQNYLQGMANTAFDNVYFYKNSVLFLDDQDLPFPGGHYFEDDDTFSSTPGYYRICYLSAEKIDFITELASEWKSRQNVHRIPFLTKIAVANPKFLNLNPISGFGFSESNVISTGLIQRKKSQKKPQHIIQDILNSYYNNISRYGSDLSSSIGLIIEWPIYLIFENSKPIERENYQRKFIALSVNGTQPEKAIYVLHPYERYMLYDNVPATLWTPISFAYSFLRLEHGIRKVSLDTVVIGLVYKEMFFCLSQPLFEGEPTDKSMLNTKYILNIALIENIQSDPNIQILESFLYNDNFSLRKIALKGVPLETWCLTKAEMTHPRVFKLPHLVQEWLNFVRQAGGSNTFDVDISLVRLALMLSKHNICYTLEAIENKTAATIKISETEIKFQTTKDVVEFLNDVRILKKEEKEEPAAAAWCVVS